MNKYKTRTVRPYGKIFSQGRGYFLLNPHAIEQDSWQNDNTHRFAVVPDVVLGKNKDRTRNIFSYARHIVTNSFVLEYITDMPEITILDIERIDISRTEKQSE